MAKQWQGEGGFQAAWTPTTYASVKHHDLYYIIMTSIPIGKIMYRNTKKVSNSVQVLCTYQSVVSIVHATMFTLPSTALWSVRSQPTPEQKPIHMHIMCSGFNPPTHPHIPN